jgi:hypothetical protein
MSTFTVDEDIPILVEFAPRPGLQQVSLSPADLAAKSAQALDKATGTIAHMAKRMRDLHDKIPTEFTQVELEFGIKLDAEAGALLSKVGAEASINVKLTWERRGKTGEQHGS